MGTNLGPAFPVNKVHMILQKEEICNYNNHICYNLHNYHYATVEEGKMCEACTDNKGVFLCLKAANSYIDLTTALIRTVEHLEHPISLDDWASPVSLWPHTAKTETAGVKSLLNSKRPQNPLRSVRMSPVLVFTQYLGHTPAQAPLQLSLITYLQRVNGGLQQLLSTETCGEKRHYVRFMSMKGVHGKYSDNISHFKQEFLSKPHVMPIAVLNIHHLWWSLPPQLSWALSQSGRSGCRSHPRWRCRWPPPHLPLLCWAGCPRRPEPHSWGRLWLLTRNDSRSHQALQLKVLYT